MSSIIKRNSGGTNINIEISHEMKKFTKEEYERRLSKKHSKKVQE